MSADDDVAEGLEAFFADYADAWAAGDVDEIADFFILPQMIVRQSGTVFVEDPAELLGGIEGLLADWARHGVVRAVPTIASVTPLPDDAARVTVEWSRQDVAGAAVMDFSATYTLVAEEGEWSIIVSDTVDEEHARAEAGWSGPSRLN